MVRAVHSDLTYTVITIMSNVQNPTYFLAPNWTNRPGGKIAIGNIIRNPLKPHLVLTKPDPRQPAATTEKFTERNWRLSVETARNVNLSLWAEFLEVIKLSLNANRERIRSSSFTMSSLDTITLVEEPTPEEIKTRCNDPLVVDYMRPDSLRASPVYMVTGIKVAKDFKLEGEATTTKGLAGELGGQISPEASIGGGAGGSRTDKISDAFEADGDIVFAYQLMKIQPKGWGKEKTFETSEYQHRQAFLDSESGKAKQEKEEVDGEKGDITTEELRSFPRAQTTDINGITVAFERPKESN
jgi:hypothetical protein